MGMGKYTIGNPDSGAATLTCFHSGGPETAEALGKNLIPCVAKAMAAAKASGDAPVSAEEAIQNSFVSLDNRILGAAEAAINAGHPAGTAAVRAAMAPAQTGSCALLAVYEAGSASLYIALAGDSRAVRGQSSSETDKLVVDVLTEDQNACNEQEYARVAAEHPGEESVILNTDRGTVLGLGMSRAFGNANSKWSNELLQKAQTNCHGPRPVSISKTPPYITASPVVTTRVVEAQDFVILGSDGLWEQISHEHAVECVSRWRAARRAGKPEAVVESGESRYTVNEDGSLYHVAQPEDFAIEDLDNAAVCLIKNVLGGRHRYMVAGAVTATTPIRRMVRDDLTAQVIFFEDP